MSEIDIDSGSPGAEADDIGLLEGDALFVPQGPTRAGCCVGRGFTAGGV